MNEQKQEIAELRAELKELKENPEIWVPIKDNLAYFVSNKGRVKTYDDYYPKITLDRSRGYYRVKLNGKPYYLHRLLAEAFIPNPDNKPFVDHIDGDPLNNCLSNLRWCTHAENMRNRKKHRNNTSGHKGVSFHKVSGKWRAQIKVDGEKNHLGLYDSPEEAAAAYEEAAKEAFGEYYRET